MADTSAAEAALKAKLSRKRTKTGCLTCRKRRIKCGEERPVCSNCIKSKRHCEGYNQRVVFKPPAFEYQPVANGSAHITFQAGNGQEAVPSATDLHAAYDQSSYTQLRPRPSQGQFLTVWNQHSQQYVQVPAPEPEHVQQSPPEIQQPQPQRNGPISPGHIIRDPFGFQRLPQTQNHHVHGTSIAHSASVSLDSAVHDSRLGYTTHEQQNGLTTSLQHYGIPAVSNIDSAPVMYGDHVTQAQPHMNLAHPVVTPLYNPWAVSSPTSQIDTSAALQTPASVASSMAMSFSQQTPGVALQSPWHGSWHNEGKAEHGNHDFIGVMQPHLPHLGQPHRDQISQSHHHQPPVEQKHFSQYATAGAEKPTTPEYYEHETHAPPTETPTYMLNAAAIESLDDDYYDVESEESDEEQDVDTSLSQSRSHRRQRMLGKVLDGKQISIRGLHMRRYDTFIYEGILDTYRVEYVASPLKNPATARVFAHFISATGPSLSVFERAPISSSVLFNEGTVPISQQGLWTYTLPMAALHHQGLLHAMLALASLHIARLQGASTTPSMQHYAWALRRIHAAVSNPKSRLKVTTIAASMLLGFYEIMTADHMKWNMHLAGAKQLFVETDFVKMTSEFRRLKFERAARLQCQPGRKRRHSSEEPFSQADMLDQMPEVDDRVVSQMVGKEVRYDGLGHIETTNFSLPPALDLGKFEILKDLYWWYCKQDVIQSIVSGNPLLMDFSRWANCPPRAPLGRGDAVYGSFDHLVLLLGRIADFSSRDRKRKLKQMEMNGGQWRPAAGMNIPRPPQAQAQPPPSPAAPINPNHGFPMPGSFIPPPGASMGAPPTMPDFYGMAPPPKANIQMPSSYSAFPQQTPHTPHSATKPDFPSPDTPATIQDALQEHTSIRQALDTFERSLSGVHAFQPLESDSYHSTDTAFGSAYFYRTYDIGCLWALYHMAVIIAIRAHPHMPPAAHMAAGVAAQETKHHAIEIGRIVAGIVPGPENQALNPSLGAALCESCMPSFFAAVQYQDPRQRYETVTRIFSIARRTGWGSAELIANGCETAWVKAAAAGRGPPYTRIVRAHHMNSEDPRLNGSWERLDPSAAPVDGDDADRRLIKTKREARLNWAIGVMGVEEDIEKLRIVD
ncbi:putative zn(2)-C6 fungal-type DNA-binding domain, fungal transcription factor [Septoria linicola]|nr:putative zn(2)-C6 fungal-type DNA-binding domain, fungal transcription factor [Septoria linicola]